MESLLKLIFYLIIITFWALNNIKKQRTWEKDLPSPPEHPSESEKPVQEPSSLQPAKLDIIDKNAQPIVPEVSMLSYEQILEMRRERAKARKDKKLRKKPAPAAAPKPETKAVEAKMEVIPALSKKEVKKPTLYLKSNVKEGIIWSIILGPPRSRVHFNWKSSPIQR